MKVTIHPTAAQQIEAIVARPSGTVLLHGPRGVGKRTLALEIARRLNCGGESYRDESCRSCRMAAGGNHPNIIVVMPDEKGKIGVEPVHALQHSLHYQQYEPTGQRVVVLSRADTLTLPAQNALLKTLEEPPLGTTILLTSEQPQSLLSTVLSRCSLLYVPPVPAQQLTQFLQEAGISDAATLVEQSHGLPGRALSYAREPAASAQLREVAGEVERLLAAEGLLERLSTSSGMAAQADRRIDYLEELTQRVRRAARANVAVAANIAAVERLQQRLRANVNPKTAFEALAVELA